ncbi:MAG: hypothetical protein ACRC2R_23575 [Xenococcaceae cyanobacterium]
MTIQTLENQTIASGELPKAIAQNNRKLGLVARWLVDRNSQLYCQWVLEN